MSKMISHEELVKQALTKPAVFEAYNDLQEEFELLQQMVHARNQSGKTQRDLAKAMHTSTSVIGRLESGGGKKRHSPSLSTLRKYADALGLKLSINFLPKSNTN